MVNVLDENGVRKLAQGIKDNCKEWVKDKKIKKQIVIGRAIPLKSYGKMGRQENWYVSNKNILIKIPTTDLGITSENFNPDEELVVYIDNILTNHCWRIRSVDSNNIVVWSNSEFQGDYGEESQQMLHLDDYIYKGDKLYIWLTKKKCPLTISGTSHNHRLVQGMRVYKERPPVSLGLAVITDLWNKRYTKKKIELRRIRKDKRNGGRRNRGEKYGYKKRGELIWLYGKTDSDNFLRGKLRDGVYQIRYTSATWSYKTEWTFFYARMDINGFVYVKEKG